MVSKEDKAEPIESSVPISAGNWKSVPVLHEWWDTPVRFKRREVDELECDIINVSSVGFLFLSFPLVYKKFSIFY